MRKDFYQCSYWIFFICIGIEQLATRAIFYPAHMPAGLEAALAWKNNEFMFDGEPIEVIMKRISRWYDVEIIYRGEKQTENS